MNVQMWIIAHPILSFIIWYAVGLVSMVGALLTDEVVVIRQNEALIYLLTAVLGPIFPAIVIIGLFFEYLDDKFPMNRVVYTRTRKKIK